MTSLLWSGSRPVSPIAGAQQLPAARAFWLLLRLRLQRLQNRTGLGSWHGATAAAAGTRRRSAASQRASGRGLLLGLALLVGLFCFQSLGLFTGLAEQHGAAGLQGRASLLSSASVLCFFLVGLLGSRAHDGQGDDDADWLLTLPAPAWVLHTARLVEAALSTPSAWLMIFPFFTGLGLHTGLGLLAPVVALGISLPLFLTSAVLGNVIDVLGRSGSQSAAFRALRLIGAALGLLVFAAWLVAPTLQGRVDLLGKWLDFSAQLAWLPFSEPARALLCWQEAPLRALAWLGLFGVETSVLLGLGWFVLRQAHFTKLSTGSRTRGAVAQRARAAAQPAPRSPLRAVIAKDWLCMRRKPALASQVGTVVIVANGIGLWLVHRLSGMDASARPGIALFGAGVVLIIRLATLLELEQPALWQWAALPRSLSAVFSGKALFATGFALAGALPATLYTLLSAGGAAATLPPLLYGATSVAAVAFFQTAVWLRNASPSAATSRLQELGRIFKVLFVAGMLFAGFSSSVSLGGSFQQVALAAVFAVTFWQTSLERVPYVLDPDSSRPSRLTSLSAFVVLLIMRFLQNGLQSSMLRKGALPATAVTSGLVAAGIVLGLSLLWFWLLGVPRLRQQLGVTRGRGWRVILREAALWSAPAVAILLASLYFFGRRSSALPNQPVAEQPLGVILGGAPALSLVLLLCVAGPVLEELMFRGMLYSSLRTGYGVALSTFVSALLFMADHTPLNAVPIFCAAVCMALAFERSRSVYAAMLVHAAYNGTVAALLLILR